MVSFIRRRLTATNGVLVVALVLMMSGGAYAASKALITSTKQISPKVLKELKGANGVNGRNGTNGSSGAQGPQGEKGQQGEKGAIGPMGPSGSGAGGLGATGPQGVAGATGPTGSAGSVGATGPTGKEGATGKEGPTGKTGATGPTGGMLEQGKTERGTFALTMSGIQHKERNEGAASISFPIPVTPLPEQVEVLNEEEKTNANCPKRKPAEAKEGVLCVYIETERPLADEGKAAPTYLSPAIAEPFGYVLEFTTGEEGHPGTQGYAYGEWAVTAK